jgi:hypothetical protein
MSIENNKSSKAVKKMLIMQVCKTCYKFFQTIYDNKKIKKLTIIPDDEEENIQCNSSYHKKLVDSFKS